MAKGKYARKRLLKELRACQLCDSGLSTHTVRALETAGIKNLADLALKDEKDIRIIRGIGPKAIAEIAAIRTVKQCDDERVRDHFL